jgi:hypothetical protein
MTDRTCICSGEQSKVEEESVGGGQIRQSGRPLASSSVRPSDPRRSLIACRKEPISSTLDQRDACNMFH